MNDKTTNELSNLDASWELSDLDLEQVSAGGGKGRSGGSSGGGGNSGSSPSSSRGSYGGGSSRRPAQAPAMRSASSCGPGGCK